MEEERKGKEEGRRRGEGDGSVSGLLVLFEKREKKQRNKKG